MLRDLLICLCSFTVFTKEILTSKYTGCIDRSPLGMRNGFIHTSQLNVSSSYDSIHGEARGRLDSRISWCSKATTNASQEYFQVRFENLTFINGIGIQGNPEWEEYVIKFRLMYKTEESDEWTYFLQGKVFNGNIDTNNIAYKWFPSTLIARTVRLIPVEICDCWDDDYVCLRIELYGCLDYGTLYPLGMERKIIADKQLESNGLEVYVGRLHTSGYGLYSLEKKLYIKIDFRNVMLLEAIAIQGYLQNNGYAKGVVTSYRVYFTDSSGDFKQLESTFPGNVDIGADPVLSVLPQPVTTEKLKIVGEIYENTYHCMKFEFYGKVAGFNEILSDFSSSPPSARNKSQFPHDAYIDSPISWCPGERFKGMKLSFREPVVVTGISLQGDSQNDSWVESYGVRFRDIEGRVEVYTSLKGVSSRIDPVSVQWFSRYLLVKQITLIPEDYDYQNCLRFNVYGNKQVISKPRDVHLYQLNNKLTFTWKPPDFALFKITKYEISIMATKRYNHSFSYSFNRTLPAANQSSVEIFIEFGAANLEVHIIAISGNYYKKRISYFIIDTMTPDAPLINSNETFNGRSMQTNINFTLVSNIKGPISGYQVIFSTIPLNISAMETVKLCDQTKSQAKKLPYFLLKYIPQSDFIGDSYNLPPIIDGEEEILAYNASLPIFGTFYIYIRAVILKEDILSLGYGIQTYYGAASELVIHRQNATEQPCVASILSGDSVAVKFTRVHETIQYYEIVVMQTNQTRSEIKSPSSYAHNLLKRYEDAALNEPYITVVLNSSVANSTENVTIGDDIVFEGNASSDPIKKDSYRNGKLRKGVPYIYFQRAVDAEGNEYSSPWSEEFQLPEPESSKAPVTIEKQKLSSNILMIVAIVAGCILILLICCLLVFCICKRRKE